jgi:hypothetical protein
VTAQLLMIKPTNFRMNEQTAVNNHFQSLVNLSVDEINLAAQREFDEFVSVLRKNGVGVIVVEDQSTLDTPDVIFPNNWVSFHEDGTMVLYPMFAENRRLERRVDIVDIMSSYGYEVCKTVDLSPAETNGRFLEGTGSMILDRKNKIAYCAISPRSDKFVLDEFCKEMHYRALSFTANQTVGSKRVPIYHTNVMMAIAETFAVLCLDCIDDLEEKQNVESSILNSGKELIVITEDQMHRFAGNMLQVIGADDTRFLVMSEAAFSSLSEEQMLRIRAHCDIIHTPLEVIETCGGGSARCMLAEVFLQK